MKEPGRRDGEKGCGLVEGAPEGGGGHEVGDPAVDVEERGGCTLDSRKGRRDVG
jgi:hypothetical protein